MSAEFYFCSQVFNPKLNKKKEMKINCYYASCFIVKTKQKQKMKHNVPSSFSQKAFYLFGIKLRIIVG